MESESKFQELQFLEQNLQNILMQKQAFEMEFAETESALSEISKTSEDVFKIIGQLLIKGDKIKIKEELENRKKLLQLRINSLDKQEKTFSDRLSILRNELLKSK
jgi:prefoldin beta subunit